MRFLRYLVLGLLAAILLVLIAAIFVGRDFSYKKTIHIFARPQKVWTHVNTIKKINTWNPWLHKDNGMNVLISGQDGKPGAKLCWTSNRRVVGRGCLIFKELKPYRLVECQLQLISPHHIDGQMYIRIEPAKVYGSMVSWEFRGQLPYQLRLIHLFTGVSRYLEKEMSRGLGQLKHHCENR